MWVQLGDVYDKLQVGVEIDYFGNFSKPLDDEDVRSHRYSVYRIDPSNFWLVKDGGMPIHCPIHLYLGAWIRFVKVSSCDVISEICFTGTTSDANLKFLIEEILKC